MSGYVGRGINYGNAATDHFTGNGGATYTLNYDTTTDGVIVSLDGVVQKNGTDFNVTSGTSLVFTSVVASPIAIQVVYTGLTLALGTPADGTVSTAKIANDAVTAPKTDLSIVQGDVIYGSGTDAWARLGAGTSGQFLKTQGAGANPVWADATHTGNVAFPATQVASADPNTLDDYEEGIFNITVASNTGTLTINGGSDTLAYIKIGRMVHINGEISFSTASSPAGTFFIYGLPFACESLAEGAETCIINSLTTNANSAFEGLKFYTVAGSTTLFGRHEGRTNDGSNCANYVDTGSAVRLTGTYYATD